MGANLMGSAGFQREADDSEPFVYRQGLIVGDGGFSIRRNAHPPPVFGIDPYRETDRSGRRIGTLSVIAR